jgi:hypothetical protein
VVDGTLACLPGGFTQLGLAVLRYVDDTGLNANTTQPITQAW